MKLRLALICCLLLIACGAPEQKTPDFGISESQLKSGFEFLTADSQSLQQDSFSNPGYLWVEKGEKVFKQSGCIECHSEVDFRRTASDFPKIRQTTSNLINIQGQINYCRTERLEKGPLLYESEDMLSLTTYIKNRSLQTPQNFVLTRNLRRHFDKGKTYYNTRRGQLNLSCAQCHDQNWGKKMRGDTVSQGHINGFPAFRNDWQTLGSSHRRFQACNIGVRAEPMDLGSQEYLELEVYLMARGSGLANETPSIRR